MSTITFGSPEAALVLAKDKKLREQEELTQQPKRWYVVGVEETVISNYRVKATDETDALDRCLDDGIYLEAIDCFDANPRGAELDKKQED